MNTNVIEGTLPRERRSGRRSDRISLALRIRVSGVTGLDQEFATTTRTLLVSRHGAKILLEHDLVPHGELNVGCLNTNLEADARLVGFMGEEPEGPTYGIEFLNPSVNLWNIVFPPLAESSHAVARALLQCPRCRRTSEYAIRWMRRTRKVQIPPGASDRDRALFAKVKDHLIRVDDDVTCKVCGKRFEIPTHRGLIFLEELEGLPQEDYDE